MQCVSTLKKHWDEHEIKCDPGLRLMFNHLESRGCTQGPGPRVLHLELPGGSHHDNEIHICVNGRAHPCIVVHKLLGGHLQWKSQKQKQNFASHHFGGGPSPVPVNARETLVKAF